ncbi:MAG TPA: hypothetical protein VI729_04450 [Anaerolineales bacterium]|nr:hypothetical protein [Anaerolineales bacterium]
MLSNDKPITKAEAYPLVAASILLALWYATPQLFYSFYSLYEFARLLAPGLLKSVGAGA